ncbi:MAG: FAD-binding protein [Candidatus Beckwithbacteria bacterium]
MKLSDFTPNELLKNHTTFQIGGSAEYFFEAKTTAQLLQAVKLAEKLEIPFIILGSGSNVLISDNGIKGLVIKNSTSKIRPLANHQVELDSGVFLPKAIFSLINQGLTGLEVFSGIPATVGGATAVKMHGVGKNWQDFIVKVRKYHQVILSVTLQLQAGDPVAALALAKKIQASKSHQPQRSSGCIFRNPPGQSAGKIIDQQLKLKNTRIGQARISPAHANFIENLNGATASEVLQLIRLIQQQAKNKLNLKLDLEIILLGF